MRPWWAERSSLSIQRSKASARPSFWARRFSSAVTSVVTHGSSASVDILEKPLLAPAAALYAELQSGVEIVDPLRLR